MNIIQTSESSNGKWAAAMQLFLEGSPCLFCFSAVDLICTISECLLHSGECLYYKIWFLIWIACCLIIYQLSLNPRKSQLSDFKVASNACHIFVVWISVGNSSESSKLVKHDYKKVTSPVLLSSIIFQQVQKQPITTASCFLSTFLYFRIVFVRRMSQKIQ